MLVCVCVRACVCVCVCGARVRAGVCVLAHVSVDIVGGRTAKDYRLSTATGATIRRTPTRGDSF